MTNVLFVVTAADHWTLADGTEHPTGYWAEELVESHRVFKDAGYNVTIATPGGRAPTLDQNSLALEFNENSETRVAELQKYLADLKPEFDEAAVLEDADVADYDLVFVPGGHGPMEDLAVSEQFGALLRQFFDAGKVISAVCHAPASLLPARGDNGWLFDGYQLTGFTNDEESQVGFAPKAKWLLEDRLRESGARFAKADAWTPYVVVDRKLYTGQNPASSRPLAERIVADVG